MSNNLNELSHSLASLHGQFAGETGDRVFITRDDIDRLVQRLRLMTQLAHRMEIELIAHRLGEANRAGRAMVEELATDTMRNLVEENSGNVIRPNFRRPS